MPDSEYADALPFDAVLQSGDNATTQEDGLSNAEIRVLEDFRDYFRPIQPACRKQSKPLIYDHGVSCQN